MSILTLPDLGEGLQHAEIVSWHVAVGDHVVTSQPLVAVETDKAVVDVPAPAAGTIARLYAEVGDLVAVGAALVDIDQGERVDTGTVVGELKTAGPAAPPAPAPVAQQADSGIKATPAVRALAARHRLALNKLVGSGPGGAILSSDVEQAVTAGRGAHFEPLRGVRRAMAERMALAHAQVVPASLHADADIEHWPEHTDATLRLVQAIAAACGAEPALNTWLDMKNQSRQLHPQVDLGIAVDTAEGLFVPTLRDVGSRSSDNLRAALETLKQDVLNRSIPPEELRGQTITLSNFGSIGGRYAELVVVPPQVAIIGAGRITPAVLAIDGKVVIHRQLPLSLSFDHRAVTGAEAARFMTALISELEH